MSIERMSDSELQKLLTWQKDGRYPSEQELDAWEESTNRSIERQNKKRESDFSVEVDGY